MLHLWNFLSKVNSFDGNVNKSSFAADHCNNIISPSPSLSLYKVKFCGKHSMWSETSLHQFSIKPFKQSTLLHLRSFE